MWTNYNIFQSSSSPYFGDFVADSHFRPTKRKMNWLFDISGIEPRPAKVQVTEEVMANQLQELHLSNSFTTHGSQQSVDEAAPSTSGVSDTTSDFGQFTLPKLTLCDELRALKDSLSIIPEVLQTNKPSTALMLWQPPAGSLGSELQLEMEKQKDQNTEDEQNSGGAVKSMEIPVIQPSPAVAGGMEVELLNNNNMSSADIEISRAV